MGVLVGYLDTILVPFSLLLTVGYHAYLWYTFKTKPSRTTINVGIESHRRTWFSDIKKLGDGKKGMLAVQSLRNSQMVIILTASIAIIFNISLAALTNNAYNASHVFNLELFGSISGATFALKFGSASVLLLSSFMCSSMAVAYLIDAVFLINASVEFTYAGHTKKVLETGNTLALIGNRLLCIAFPMVLWMFGPVPVAVSSVALVWWFYELDFAAKITDFQKKRPI
ncbi:uncharacterized protein LOC132804309 [Ziziphus jujuba]|uniref:Uncharacterized protein LOC132804309 n=1 Tax=Ziziphus jujuba TaxID=326968 RepID=A0ABM4ACP3_ZIZJJ|nr:uncharacterized protein LOC132804309 [Ziziphus jujuba]